jgi:hypothetical protein
MYNYRSGLKLVSEIKHAVFPLRSHFVQRAVETQLMNVSAALLKQRIEKGPCVGDELLGSLSAAQ